MFVFKLNPLGDPIFDDLTELHWQDEFNVTVTTWPVGRGYCKKEISSYESYSFKPPLSDSSCFRQITVPYFKRTTFKNFRQFTNRIKYNFRIVVGENKFRENNLHKLIKPPYSLKNYSSNYCNETFECPIEKNINLSLEMNEIDQVCRFIKFFNFLLFDEITFTIINTNKVDFIYFHNSNLLRYIRLLSIRNYLPFQLENNFGEWNVKISSFINNIFAICKNSVTTCHWRFFCDYNQKKFVGIKKVCDLNYDCINQSDEKYCSSKLHFNCISEVPVSISRSKVNDNQIDCSDRSDECKENSISSAEEVIKNSSLRIYIWFCTVAIFVLNSVSLIKCYKEIKIVDKTRLVSLYNLIFVLNLSVSDTIFGFVLAILAIFSSKYSGHYCLNDLEWRSIFACNVIGMLTIVSSQTSLNILALITGFRLYTVYKPFKDIYPLKNKIVFYYLFLGLYQYSCQLYQ